MRIAITYEDGNVFQHFGRTENFKIYETENGEIISSSIMSSGGIGHEALAGLLADHGVDVLICGGMGQGAKDALSDSGVQICAGASGDADAAVLAWLRGELTDTGVNCDHRHEAGHAHNHDHGHEHSHEHGHEHSHSHGQGNGEAAGCAGCGDSMAGCGDTMSGCGDSFAGCSGCPGCGAPQYLFEGKNVGKTVRVHYRGTFDNGEQFDASYDHDQPLEFVCGTGMMIRGFDYAVANLEPGEIIEVHLEPEEAYGMPDPRMVITVDKSTVEGSEDLEAGDKVLLQDQLGRPFDALVTAVDDTQVTFDCNHQMAGKALNFSIELLEVV